MAYNADMTWADLVRDVEARGRSLSRELRDSLEAYNEWQSFRAGRDNLTISVALARTETDVAEMDAAFSAFKEIYDYANNQTPAQGDRLFAIRKFT